MSIGFIVVMSFIIFDAACIFFFIIIIIVIIMLLLKKKTGRMKRINSIISIRNSCRVAEGKGEMRWDGEWERHREQKLHKRKRPSFYTNIQETHKYNFSRCCCSYCYYFWIRRRKETTKKKKNAPHQQHLQLFLWLYCCWWWFSVYT